MQTSDYADLLNRITTGFDRFPLTQPHRLQRTNWCILYLEAPVDIECFSAFGDFCAASFKNTASTIHYSQIKRVFSVVYIATIEKTTAGNFCKPVNPAPAMPSMLLFTPKNETAEIVRAELKAMPPMHRIPSLSSDAKKLSASQIISTDLVSATLDGRIGIRSYSNVSQAKEKILNSMRATLRDKSKTVLAPNDPIPTFWGFTLYFLPFSEKQRNFWITGPSNAGKSLFSRMLKKRFFAGSISVGTGTHLEINKATQIIILDEFKAKNAYPFPFVNQLCDNAFGFKHLYANHFTTTAAIVIVLANQPLKKTYPAKSNTGEDIWQQLSNRFIQIDLEEELRMQGITVADYPTSKHQLSQQKLNELYEPDSFDVLPDETVLDTYAASTGALAFDICASCGSRVNLRAKELEDSGLPQLGLFNDLSEVNEFIAEEEKDESVNVGDFLESHAGSDSLEGDAKAIIARANVLREEAENASVNTRERLQEAWEEVKEEAANLIGPLLGKKRKNEARETEASSFN